MVSIIADPSRTTRSHLSEERFGCASFAGTHTGTKTIPVQANCANKNESGRGKKMGVNGGQRGKKKTNDLPINRIYVLL